MSQIIGWEYYVSHFPVVIPESQFEAVEQQAEIEYRKVVGEYMEIDPADEKKRCVPDLQFPIHESGRNVG